MTAIKKERTQALPTATAPSLADISAGIAKLSTGCQNEEKILRRMQYHFDQSENPYKRRFLPIQIDPKSLYPTKARLHGCTDFGKYHSDKAYIVTPAFPQVILPLLKSGYLAAHDIHHKIRLCNKGFNRLVTDWLRTQRIDFRILRLPSFDWEATTIDKDKMFLRLAAFFHYDFDIPSVIKYCGWRWTGEHRRTKEILFWLRYILSADLFESLKAGYLHGTPNKMISDNEVHTYANYLRYRHSGNLRSIAEEPALVMKQFAKEAARDISMLLPEYVADFMQNLGLIPIGIVIEDHKKPRIYRHASKKLDRHSLPVNEMVSAETEPPIHFGTVPQEYIEYVWRIRATYPNQRILQYTDDLASCFNQRQTAPILVGANASIWEEFLILPIGMHFGGTWGPANNEPVADARGEICKYLFNYCSYQLKLNQKVLDHVKVILPELKAPLAQAKLDNPSQLQKHADGSFKLEYKMYIDDAQTAIPACVPNGVNRLVASSIESCYILLGYPGPIDAPIITPVMAWDKLEGFAIQPTMNSLGRISDSDNLELQCPTPRLIRLRDILTRHWNVNRKRFTPRIAAQLIGNLISCLQTNDWLKMACLRFQSYLRIALRNNAERLIKTKHFQALLQERSEAWLEPSSGDKDAKLLGIQSRQSRALWQCKEQTFTPAPAHQMAEWLIAVINEHLATGLAWRRPISQVVRRECDWNAFQDASTSWGIGGHSPDLFYFWQMAWLEFGPEVVAFILATLNKGSDTDAHINWFEYLAAVVNYCAVIVASQEERFQLPFPPVVCLHGDNMTSNKVTKKGLARTDSYICNALARIHASIQRQARIGIDTAYVNTKINKFADDLSRDYLESWRDELLTLTNEELITYSFLPSQTSNVIGRIKRYRRFRLHPELIALLSKAVLTPTKVDLLPKTNLKNLGQLYEDSNIFTSS